MSAIAELIAAAKAFLTRDMTPFVEADHPRGPDGKFIDKPEGAASAQAEVEKPKGKTIPKDKLAEMVGNAFGAAHAQPGDLMLHHPDKELEEVVKIENGNAITKSGLVIPAEKGYFFAPGFYEYEAAGWEVSSAPAPEVPKPMAPTAQAGQTGESEKKLIALAQSSVYFDQIKPGDKAVYGGEIYNVILNDGGQLVIQKKDGDPGVIVEWDQVDFIPQATWKSAVATLSGKPVEAPQVVNPLEKLTEKDLMSISDPVIEAAVETFEKKPTEALEVGDMVFVPGTPKPYKVVGINPVKVEYDSAGVGPYNKPTAWALSGEDYMQALAAHSGMPTPKGAPQIEAPPEMGWQKGDWYVDKAGKIHQVGDVWKSSSGPNAAIALYPAGGGSHDAGEVTKLDQPHVLPGDLVTIEGVDGEHTLKNLFFKNGKMYGSVPGKLYLASKMQKFVPAPVQEGPSIPDAPKTYGSKGGEKAVDISHAYDAGGEKIEAGHTIVTATGKELKVNKVVHWKGAPMVTTPKGVYLASKVTKKPGPQDTQHNVGKPAAAPEKPKASSAPSAPANSLPPKQSGQKYQVGEWLEGTHNGKKVAGKIVSASPPHGTHAEWWYELSTGQGVKQKYANAVDMKAKTSHQVGDYIQHANGNIGKVAAIIPPQSTSEVLQYKMANGAVWNPYEVQHKLSPEIAAIHESVASLQVHAHAIVEEGTAHNWKAKYAAYLEQHEKTVYHSDAAAAALKSKLKNGKLLPGEAASIASNYIGSGYVEINNVLRGVQGYVNGNPKSVAETLRQAEVLSKAMQPHTTKDDLKLYRGVKHLSAIIPDLHHNPEKYVGTVIKERGFLSASTSSGTANSFASDYADSAVFHIHVPKGTVAVSGHTGESELIIDKGQKLLITKITKGKMNRPLIEALLLGPGAPDPEGTPVKKGTVDIVMAPADEQHHRFVWSAHEIEWWLPDGRAFLPD